jgi:hypothetical protein
LLLLKRLFSEHTFVIGYITMPDSDDDSSSSSSNDGLGFDSPDNSDDDGNDEGDHKRTVLDPFKFQAHKFTKVNVAVTSHQYPSPTSRKRTRSKEDVSSELEKKLHELQRNKQARLQALQRKAQQQQQGKKSDDDDDSDDDSDLEDSDGIRQRKRIKVGQPQQSQQPAPPKPKPDNVIELLDDDGDSGDAVKKPAAVTREISRATRASGLPRAAPAGNTRAAAAAVADKSAPDSALDLTWSSDDDSDTGGGAVSRAHELRNNPLSNEAAQALQRARRAQSHLRQAQHYHAHDLYVPVPEPDPPQRFRSGSTSNTNVPLSGVAKASMNLGKAFKITCCTKLKIKGEERPCDDASFTVRENEPLQVLIDNYIRTLRLPGTAKVTMVYRDQTLSKHGTPKSYNLMNRASIQCTAEASYLVALNAASPSAPVNKPKKVLGKSLNIKCQLHIKFKDPKKKTKPLTSTLEIRELEKLSVLLDPMRKNHKIPPNLNMTVMFDGELCEEKTPKDYDMESDDIVEFTVKDVGQLWYKEE